MVVSIIVGVLAASIVLGVFGNYLYKKVTHKPTGECACCAKKGETLVKMYNKKYKSKK